MLPANNSLESALHQTLLSNFQDFLSLIWKSVEIRNQGDVAMLYCEL